MGFWRKIAALAARHFDPCECTECPPGLPGQDPAFTTAVTALGAKLARADGKADASEFAAFASVFQPDARSAANIERLYELARQTTLGFESYATRLAKRYHQCPGLLEDVLTGLFHIASADGQISSEELRYLKTVSELFGQRDSTFRRLKATHLGLTHEDPYGILQISPEATEEALRMQRRKLLAEVHPDRVRARGLPEEYLEVFTKKAAIINAAFDAIMAERNLDRAALCGQAL